MKQKRLRAIVLLKNIENEQFNITKIILHFVYNNIISPTLRNELKFN